MTKGLARPMNDRFEALRRMAQHYRAQADRLRREKREEDAADLDRYAAEAEATIATVAQRRT